MNANVTHTQNETETNKNITNINLTDNENMEYKEQ